MNEKKTGNAYLVRNLNDFKGKAKLFRVDPAYETSVGKLVDHVIVVLAPPHQGWPETTSLLPSDAEGHIIGWHQLECELKGHDVKRSLELAGYRITEEVE